MFFYCSAPGACEDGMIGVVNPNSTHTLAIQELYAHNATIAFSPGEGFPPEIKSPAAPSPTSSSSAATTSTPAASASSSHPALSPGAIAGISIGGAAVLLLGGALVYLCGRQRTIGEFLHRDHRSSLPPPSYIPGPGHASMASSAAYTKSPHLDVEPQRYSALGIYRGGEDERYRSRSPPVDEGGEFGNLGLGVNGNGMAKPARTASPLITGPGVTLEDGPLYDPVGVGGG